MSLFQTNNTKHRLSSLVKEECNSNETLLLSSSSKRNDSKLSFLKTVSLILFTGATSATFTLAIRLSQRNNTYNFNFQHVVLLAETLKFVFSVTILIFNGQFLSEFSSMTWRETLPYTIPAFCFSIDNVCQFVALQLVDAPTFSLVQQIKILITAFLWRSFFDTKFTQAQLSALLFLFLGVVSSKSYLFSCTSPANETSTSMLHQHFHNNRDFFVGTALIVFVSFLSSLADVYSELIFKRKMSQTIHAQNAKLYFFGIVFNALLLLVSTQQQPQQQLHNDQSIKHVHVHQQASNSHFTVVSLAILLTMVGVSSL